jgi:hypothetical protein
MVAMPLTLNATGQLVGTWDATLTPGYTPVTWYTTVAVGALVGSYAFDVSLAGGNTLTSLVVAVSAPESHGEQPPDAGEDTTAPVVTITPVGTLGATASFTFTAVDASTVTFECMLTTNAVEGTWAACTSPKTYTDLAVGAYIFSVRATDKGGLVSAVVTSSWSVTPDTTAPVLTVTPVGTPGAWAQFTLSSNEAGSTFECMLTKDAVEVFAWAGCTSPQTYADLPAGAYVFSARATDLAANVSQVKTQSWTVTAPVDVTPPVVTITPTVTPGETATFTLTASEAYVTYTCELTKSGKVVEAMAPCTSGVTYTGLKPGKYVLTVIGTDLSDNVTVPAATFAWTYNKGKGK